MRSYHLFSTYLYIYTPLTYSSRIADHNRTGVFEAGTAIQKWRTEFIANKVRCSLFSQLCRQSQRAYHVTGCVPVLRKNTASCSLRCSYSPMQEMSQRPLFHASCRSWYPFVGSHRPLQQVFRPWTMARISYLQEERVNSKQGNNACRGGIR